MKPAQTEPSHPTAFAAIYSPMTPQGGRNGDEDWCGVHTPWEPPQGPWRLLASACPPTELPTAS